MGVFLLKHFFSQGDGHFVKVSFSRCFFNNSDLVVLLFTKPTSPLSFCWGSSVLLQKNWLAKPEKKVLPPFGPQPLPLPVDEFIFWECQLTASCGCIATSWSFW